MSNESIKRYRETTKEIVLLKELEATVLVEPIKEGKWSIREIIGHLLYWDKFILEQHIPFMAEGAKLKAFPDHDSYNNEGLQYTSRFDVLDLINKFEYTRIQLFNAINHIDEEVRFTIGSGKQKYTINSYFSIFAKHDIHHLAQINNKLSI